LTPGAAMDRYFSFAQAKTHEGNQKYRNNRAVPAPRPNGLCM